MKRGGGIYFAQDFFFTRSQKHRGEFFFLSQINFFQFWGVRFPAKTGCGLRSCGTKKSSTTISLGAVWGQLVPGTTCPRDIISEKINALAPRGANHSPLLRPRGRHVHSSCVGANRQHSLYPLALQAPTLQKGARPAGFEVQASDPVLPNGNH